MKKKLIVSGDSCSDLNFRSSPHPDWDTSYKKWPEHLAEHLGMELVCLGKSGHGNQYIYHSLLDEILRTPKEEIGLVAAGWSQAMRKDWQFYDRWANTRIEQDGNLYGWVSKTLRHYISFQILCEKFDLPYFHFQMGDLFEAYFEGLIPTEDEVKVGKKYKLKYDGYENDDAKIIEKVLEYNNIINNFIGWPGINDKYKELGGFNMLQIVTGESKKEQQRRGLVISELDDHPNKLGHKAIADFIIEELDEELY
tara:strand:+ start:15174 stop:15932 length:759 start_codon:yes stop_codon:yes gene_type:complete